MGLLINGKWDSATDSKKFTGPTDGFHDAITANGSSGFKAEPGRYHLYISLACPWASRTLIFRKLKKLEDIISLSIVDPVMLEHGWVFSDAENCIPDTVNQCNYLHEIYTLAKNAYTGKVSVPVLWDKHKKTIVNNESVDIMRMFNSEFNAFGDESVDFYPQALRAEIDAMNEKVFIVNKGVYTAGFSDNQKTYAEAFEAIFKQLAEFEEIANKNEFLLGARLTEADWRLFTTLVRFDAVYYVHFKCNLRRIIDYPHLDNYLRKLYQYSGIAETVNFDHIKRHYYLSHRHINPMGIVPEGPELDLSTPASDSIAQK
jgi:putative glutathione S-transferase